MSAAEKDNSCSSSEAESFAPALDVDLSIEPRTDVNGADHFAFKI
jgi:hypothetical protein